MGRILGRVFVVFGSGVAVAFALGCMNLSFGGKTVVTPASDSPAKEEGLQRGKAHVPHGQEISVYYPVPYNSPPNLEFEGADGGRHFQVIDQKPDCFRVKNMNSMNAELAWKARGIPVTTAKTNGSTAPSVTTSTPN